MQMEERGGFASLEDVASALHEHDSFGKDKDAFSCNICYELASSPVVTLCGHLYCWRCVL